MSIKIVGTDSNLLKVSQFILIIACIYKSCSLAQNICSIRSHQYNIYKTLSMMWFFQITSRNYFSESLILSYFFIPKILECFVNFRNRIMLISIDLVETSRAFATNSLNAFSFKMLFHLDIICYLMRKQTNKKQTRYQHFQRTQGTLIWTLIMYITITKCHRMILE